MKRRRTVNSFELTGSATTTKISKPFNEFIYHSQNDRADESTFRS